ncbi:MAG: recombinase family protein [Vicinamibacterales bacterium]
MASRCDSATEPIDDTSTGKLMEGVLAAFAQFDNDVRSDRTRGGMRAALELGRWTSLAPLSLPQRASFNKKSLIPDPERASSVRRASQDFAGGSPFEMALREGAARAGLQVALEADRALLIGELKDKMKLPRAAGGRVWAAAGVGVGQSLADV